MAAMPMLSTRFASTKRPFAPSERVQRRMHVSSSTHQDPLLVRTARGEAVERTPVWLMRQAGRYMAEFRAYSDKYPFRTRSETPEIAVELSLQPWRAFGTDAVIFFSDILTPLPAVGVEFDVVKGKGPRIERPLRSLEDVERIVVEMGDPNAKLPFVRTVLESLRREIDEETALVGFVGAPWTLAAYAWEGKADRHLLHTKTAMTNQPQAIHLLLDRLTDMLAQYCIYQIDSGAQVMQIFDSWAHHLSPEQFQERIKEAVHDCLHRAQPGPHILNVGHGVVQGTPEEAVRYFVQVAKESGPQHGYVGQVDRDLLTAP
eukprot:jgi/Pico_ML_1/53361/g3922.t1